MEKIFLESERLFLRPLSINELFYISNNLLNKIETPIDITSLSGTVLSAILKKIIKMEHVEAGLHNWYTYWLIIDKECGKGIGFIGFKGIDQDGYAEVGYSISPDYRNRKLMTEALILFIAWSRNNRQLKGIKANVQKTNIGSIKVLKNCSFRQTDLSEIEYFFSLDF